MPVLALIDTRLAVGETDGWHYDDLPEDGRPGGRRCASSTRTRDERHGGAASPHLRRAPSRRAGPGRAGPAPTAAQWHGWPAAHVWSLWTRYACTAFYSHPWAWNEIGFPGPAYPRGYLNPGVNAREHWEPSERPGDSDPVPFADRVERARSDAATLLGGGSLMRSDYRESGPATTRPG